MSLFFLTSIAFVPDNGPVYRETTDLSLFIVEPWNAWSSLTFLVPVFIFLWQLRGKHKQYAFIVWFCCPLLVLGGLGSTFFHAFRASTFLLLMDAIPIVILVIGISIWMWLKVLPKKNPAPLGSAYFLRIDIPVHAISQWAGSDFGRLLLSRMDASPSLLFIPAANQIPKFRALIHSNNILLSGTFIPLPG